MKTGEQKPVTKRITSNITASKELTALVDNVTIYAGIKNSYNGCKEVLNPRPIGANPGLNFNPASFFFSLKSFFSDNFLYYF